MYIFFKRLHLNYKEENLLKHYKRYRLFIRHTTIGKYFVDYQKSFNILKEISDKIKHFKDKGRELIYCLGHDDSVEEFIDFENWIYGEDMRNEIDIISTRHKLKFGLGYHDAYDTEDEKDYCQIGIFTNCDYNEETKCFYFISYSGDAPFLKYDFRYNAWKDDTKVVNIDGEICNLIILDFSEYNLK